MVRRSPIGLAYAAVDGGLDYRERARYDLSRCLDAFSSTIDALDGELVNLLIFPAGYFQVRDRRARDALEERLRDMLDDAAPAFGVVVGVDERNRPRKIAADDGLPYFALYRAASGERVWMRQVSVKRKEGADRNLVARRWRDRNLLLSGTEIAFLICGESWSDELLDRVASSGCRALAIAAHRNINMHHNATGYGRLSWHRRLRAFRRQHGVPVVLAEHTRSPWRHAYAWPAAISSPLQRETALVGVTLRIAVMS